MDLRLELLEEHWSYMDGFADAMVARGPTYDGEVLTGSVHVLDLADPAAARAFAFDEPGYQAGAYRDVLLRRWRDVLGRTMGDFPGEVDDDGWLVLGLGAGGPVDDEPRVDDRTLVAYGPLLTDDGTTWLGTAALVTAPSADAAREVLTVDRYAAVEVHRWRPGGRPS
jgi:uncharacterized protein